MLIARLRAGLGRRATGLVLALLLEALLGLLLLTLSRPVAREQEVDAIATFDVAPPAPAAEPDTTPEQPSTPAPAETREPVPEEAERPPRPEPPSLVKPPAPPPPIIQLSREEMAATDIAALPARPRAPGRPMMGPPNRGVPGDTPRAEGSGPNGEPLYAAAWYRKPHDSELRGYLSTARGPGWGLIACRTVADYRVEDCVALGESPERSNIARAVLAAAWQFRVRPPQIGGVPMIGEWVRIRIDLTNDR